METPAVETPSTPEVSAPVEQAAEGHEGAPVDGSPKKETVAQKEMRKWKLKVNGAEEEVDEPELIKRAQMSSAANQRFQKAAEIEKHYQGMVEEFKTNPWKLFDALGLDADSAAEKRLIEKLRYETATPEQKRLWDLETENMTLKEKAELADKMQAEAEKAAAEKVYNDVKSKAAETIDTGIAEAIRQAGFHKPTPALVRRVAQKMLAYHEASGGELLEASKATREVLNDLRVEALDVFDGLPETDYETVLPKSFIDKIRKFTVSQVQSQPGVPRVKDRSTEPTRSADGPKKKTSTDHFFALLDKKYG